MPFYDDTELGAFKQEKLIINGAYTGAKQYIYNYIVFYEDEKIATMSDETRKKLLTIKNEVKLKGVPPKARDVSLVNEIVSNMKNMVRMETPE